MKTGSHFARLVTDREHRQGALCASVLAAACVAEVLVWKGSALSLLSAACLGFGSGILLWPVVTAIPLKWRSALLLLPPVIGFQHWWWAIQRASELVTPGHLTALPFALVLGALLGALGFCCLKRPGFAKLSRLRPLVSVVVGTGAAIALLASGILLTPSGLVAATCAILAVAELWLVVRPRRWSLLLAATAASGAALLIPSTYVALSLIAAWLGTLAVLIGLAPARAAQSWKSIALRLTLGGVVLLAADRFWDRAGGFHGGTRGGVATALAHSIRRALDADRDGYSVSFGPLDCAPFNGEVHPAALEIPGNAVDENCAFGSAGNDLAPWTASLSLPNPPPPRWQGDIVFVLVDALRWDEAQNPSLRTLKGFLERSVVFDRAYSTSTFTPQSLLGIFSATLPSNVPFAWVTPFNGCPTQAPVGLPAALQARGYATALVGVPADTTECFKPHTLGHGFGDTRSMPYFSTAQAVTEEALRTWKNLGAVGSAKSRFMVVHYLSVHNAYQSVEAYRHELLIWDAAFRALREGIGENALWVFFADHGEEFYERGVRGHAGTLYEEVVRVPLALSAPPLKPGRIRSVNSLQSLPGTVLGMVDPSASLPAALPAAYLCLTAEGPCHDQAAPLEVKRPGMHLRGLVQWPFKIIHDVSSGSWRVFDLERDAGEKFPLWPAPTNAVAALQLWEEYPFSWSPSPR